MRSNRNVLLVLAGLLVATHASAQTLEEILARNLRTRGGHDALRAVRSARLTGTTTWPDGESLPVVLELKHPDKLRVDYEVEGMTGATVYNGKRAWQIMPGWGESGPMFLPEEALRELREHVDLWVDVLSGAADPTVTLLGTEKIEGTEAFQLETRRPDGTVVHSYLDTEHCLEFKRQAYLPGEEVALEMTLGNYKPVGGLLVPHWLVVDDRVRTIATVELNVEIDDDRFTPPAAAREE